MSSRRPSRLILSLAALAGASLLATPAQAWDHVGWALAPEDLPLRVSVEVEPDVSGVTKEEALIAIQAGLQRWSDASCGVDITWLGEVAYDDPTDVPAGELHLVFAPLGQAAAPFVRLGASPDLEPLYERDNRTYLRAEPGAWVINTSRTFTSEASLEDGSCRGGTALSSTVGMLVGFNLGLDFSRQPGVLMNPDLPACTLVEPADDDIAGMDALYGPWVELACTAQGAAVGESEVPGVVPFDVTCEATPDPSSTVVEAAWLFGDGGEARGTPVTHTYTTDDNYTVRVSATLEHPTCGSVEVDDVRANYIRACAVPEPDLRIERQRGLLFRLINTSDVQTYGCHDTVRWAVFTDDGAPVLEATAWEPLVELPEEGVYQVELTLGGPAGDDTTVQTFDTREGSVRGYSVGNGCSSAAAGSTALGALVLPLILLVRRRRVNAE